MKNIILVALASLVLSNASFAAGKCDGVDDAPAGAVRNVSAVTTTDDSKGQQNNAASAVSRSKGDGHKSE